MRLDAETSKEISDILKNAQKGPSQLDKLKDAYQFKGEHTGLFGNTREWSFEPGGPDLDFGEMFDDVKDARLPDPIEALRGMKPSKFELKSPKQSP